MVPKKHRSTLTARCEHLEREVHHLRHQQELLMATAADLQKSVDDLKVAVAALQALPPPVSLITQAQLDANTADVAAAASAVAAAAVPPV